MERDALPLFSEMVAEAQPSEDQVMQARAEAWAVQEARDRTNLADKWREARCQLADLPQRERTILLHAWNRAPYPATLLYLVVR